jgi:hypothetical protein
LAKQRWWSEDDRNAKVEDFDRLIKGVFGAIPEFNIPPSLPEENFFPGPVRSSQYRTINRFVVNAGVTACVKKHRPEFYRRLVKAAKGYNLILSRRAGPSFFVDAEGMIQEWEVIERGRDIFIKGFGHFDTASVVRMWRRKDRYILPVNIRSVGYGISNLGLFRLVAAHKWFHKWCVRNIVWIRENRGRIDEITGADQLRRIKAFPDTTPQTLIRIYERRVRLWEEARNIDCTSFPEDLISALPEVETENGVLKPVSTPEECRRLGIIMSNCAASYIPRVAAKHCALVAMYKETSPVALGELQSGERKGIWNQILGPRNKSLPLRVREKFEDYPSEAASKILKNVLLYTE